MSCDICGGTPTVWRGQVLGIETLVCAPCIEPDEESEAQARVDQIVDAAFKQFEVRS